MTSTLCSMWRLNSRSRVVGGSLADIVLRLISASIILEANCPQSNFHHKQLKWRQNLVYISVTFGQYWQALEMRPLGVNDILKLIWLEFNSTVPHAQTCQDSWQQRCEPIFCHCLRAICSILTVSVRPSNSSLINLTSLNSRFLWLRFRIILNPWVTDQDLPN